ncbi:hypothetical protein [Epilithonimonas sp.]|uniref:hypothetical protein n=1 Tax=Epilithonimonas sp. TaxID=2894511 RepID=UPI0035B1D5BD
MKQKKHTIKRRILEIIERKGYKYTDFFDLLKNSSYNTFKGERNLEQGVNSDTLAEIIEIFPEVNINWLMSGKGNMFRTTIGDRMRILINEANLDRDYLSKYLGVSESFIEKTDFVSIHILYLIKKLIPTISERWLIAGDGNMYEVKAKPSKIPVVISEDAVAYGQEYEPAVSQEVSFHNMSGESRQQDFSRRLQKLLDYLMLNPTAFAKACGISKNVMVQFWLDGKYEPRPESYNKILNRYPALNRNWLFFGEGSMWTSEDYFRGKFNAFLENDQNNKKKRNTKEIIEILQSIFECNAKELAKRMGISVTTLTKYRDEEHAEFSHKVISTIHRNIDFIPMDWLER